MNYAGDSRATALPTYIAMQVTPFLYQGTSDDRISGSSLLAAAWMMTCLGQNRDSLEGGSP